MSSLLAKVPKTEALLQNVAIQKVVGEFGGHSLRSFLKGKAFLVEGVSGFRSCRGPTTTLISQRPRKASRRRRWFERREQPSHALTWMGQTRAPRKCSASCFSVKKGQKPSGQASQGIRYSATQVLSAPSAPQQFPPLFRLAARRLMRPTAARKIQGYEQTGSGPSP